jgi:hypothetical protein
MVNTFRRSIGVTAAVAAVLLAGACGADAGSDRALEPSAMPAASPIHNTAATTAAPAATANRGPATTAGPAEPTTHSATFLMVRTATAASGNHSDPVGTTKTAQWTMTADCSSGTCAVTVKPNVGPPVRLPKTSPLTRDVTGTGPCSDGVIGDSYTFHQVLRFAAGANGLPTTMTGTEVAHHVGCGGTADYTIKVTVTRVR